MHKAVIFDIDGTLIDSVDLHALAWQEAFARFGHTVELARVRHQIGKGGDKLIPVFLTKQEQEKEAEELEAWRSRHFKTSYLPLVRGFSAVPDLFRRVRAVGLKIAIGSSAKQDELERYLDIAGVTGMVDAASTSEDVSQSKPAPDIFSSALDKLGVVGSDALAVGDTPYDAEAAGKAEIHTIGVLCGGFPEIELRQAGSIAAYPGPAALYAGFDASPLNPAR
jgi:phosphoglycolate phosphatase-like HAD superfamily hydrolase